MRRWRISVIIIRCGAAFRLLCMVVGPPMQSLRCSNIWGMPHYFYFPTPIIPDFSKIATPGPIGPDPFSIITLYGKIRSTHNVYVYHLPLRRCTANYVTPIIFILGPLAQTHLPLQRYTAKYAIAIMFILGPLAQTHLPLPYCTVNYATPLMFICDIYHC